MKQRVFEGIRVLDIGHIVAGPFICTILGDFGADVIKIERPVTGDPLRWLHPKNGVGLFYKTQGRNKKCITLNLKHPAGQEIFHQLVAKSDVLVENFRPGVMERLNSGWETLSRLNPRLVMCRVSGFGQTGPYSHRRSYGRPSEAFAGFVNINGRADGPPSHAQMSLGDTIAGNWAAMGVMMALYWRDAQGGGKGQLVDMGLYEGLFRQIEQQVLVADQLGVSLERGGRNNRGVPYSGVYQTRDGRYFSFSSVTKESSMAVLRAMGMAEDPRYNTFEACLDNRDTFIPAVTQWMRSHALQEVEAAFQAEGAPGSSVMTSMELLNDAHVNARGMILQMQDKELGPIRMQGIVPKMSETPGEVKHPGQMLGESNELIYGELLGMSLARIGELKEMGVI